MLIGEKLRKEENLLSMHVNQCPISDVTTLMTVHRISVCVWALSDGVDLEMGFWMALWGL